MNVEKIAAVCHELNREYCEAIGDFSQPTWKNAPDWQKNSAINGVAAIIENPDRPPSASHDGWLKQKEAEGWIWGLEKKPEKKEHPCMVPYNNLSTEQRIKDELFTNTVKALIPLFLSTPGVG